MNRQYPDRPLIGVAAIIFRGETVLLARRGRAPGKGEWSLPGGLVELGESLEEAVQREVREEVGLEVEVGSLSAVLDRVLYDGDGRIEYHYVLLDFICQSVSGRPTAGDDVMECKFVSLADLGRYTMTRNTGEAVRRAFSRSGPSPPPVYDPDL